MTEYADAVGRDVEALGVAAYMLDRGKYILDRVGECLLTGLGQPIANRKQGIAALSEIFAPMLELATNTLHPSTAVNADQCWEWSRALGQVKVASERNAVMRGVGHARPDFEFSQLFARIHVVVPL